MSTNYAEKQRETRKPRRLASAGSSGAPCDIRKDPLRIPDCPRFSHPRHCLALRGGGLAGKCLFEYCPQFPGWKEGA